VSATVQRQEGGKMARKTPRSEKSNSLGDFSRCPWAEGHPLLTAYHDEEWGRPVDDDRLLFEMLTLEGAQAGLNWLTILKKRGGYRRAFAGFEPQRVARFDAKRVSRLMQDEGIVRNRLKINSSVENARAFLEVQTEFGSFDAYVWQFVGGKPMINEWRSMKQVPPRTKDSDAMSKDLKSRGFKFVGSTICYAFMQAVGMVDDHILKCWVRNEERVG
jgi:DNA-3-methyladenine glycosylase I